MVRALAQLGISLGRGALLLPRTELAACRVWAYPLAHDRGWPLLRQGDFAFQPASLSWAGDPRATLLQWYHVADPAPTVVPLLATPTEPIDAFPSDDDAITQFSDEP